MFKKTKLKGAIPDHIISVLETIENNGFKAFVVGGAIRDILIGRVPIEYDLASSATPNDIKKIFKNTSSIGEKFGTICIHQQKKIIEITTFRRESNYANSRHPETVQFSNSIEEDLLRRDFTINAMAYHPSTDTLIDPFNGVNDLNHRLLNCVGNASERLSEDSLRAFRCFRFMSQLGFVVSKDVIHALQHLSDIPLPSVPRIRSEMDRLILGRFWLSTLTLMKSTQWLPRIIPETPSIESIQIPEEHLYRWAWLLSKADLTNVGLKLQFSKSDIRHMNLINKWSYDEYAINLTVNDIEISTNTLIEFGYTNKALGSIQKDLLHLIRQKKLKNNTESIQNYLKNKAKNSE